MTVTDKNGEGIGVFYKFIGSLVIMGLFTLIVLQHRSQHDMNKWDLLTYVAVLVLALALLRPKPFDQAVRWLADKLPFIPYTKPPAP